MHSLFLQSSDIEKIVSETGFDALMDLLIARLREAILSLDSSQATIPVRDGLQYGQQNGLLEWMPVYLEGQGAAIKIVGYHPTNPNQRNLPSVISSIGVYDTQSGHLLGLVDGTFLTALRTGAMTAIASQVLAKPDSRRLCLVGCGAQAVTQVHALSRIYQFERIYAYDIDSATVASLESRLSFLGMPIQVIKAAELEDALQVSDIVCTATSAAPGSGAVIEDFNGVNGLHVNAVGSDFIGKVELPLSMLKRGCVVPDFREQAMREGECQQLSPTEVGPDLLELLQQSERYSHLRNELTVFDSTGWAFADYVNANLFIELAHELKVGTRMQLECIPTDSKNPYSFISKKRPV